VFLFPFFIFSQKIDSVYVYNKNVKAAELEREGEFSQASLILKDLLYELSINNEASKYFGITYQTQAKVLRSQGFYEESIDVARKSLAINLKNKDSFNIADSYNTIGVNHYLLSDFDSTKIYYERSLEIKKKIKINPYALAVSAYNLAILYEDLAQPNEGLRLYKEAEQYLLRSKKPKNFLSDVYTGIAHNYFHGNDIDKAEEYAEKALDVGLRMYGEFNPNITFVYTTYANILESKKQYKASIELLEKSLKIRRSSYGENHKWTCESYYDLANVYTLDKQFDKSEVYFKKAIEIGKKNNNLQYLANAKTYLAKMYLEQNKNLDVAEMLLLSSLEIKISILGYKNDLIAENYFYLAEISKKRQEQDKFFAFITQVFNCSAYDKNNLSVVIAPIEVLDALILVGDWFEEEFNSSQDIKFLQKKYDLIEEQVKLIKHTQKNFTSDRSRIKIANEYRNVFEKGLNTCWKLYYKTKEVKYLEKAFELSETNRNTTLLEGLQDSKYKLYSGIPTDLLDYEKQTKRKLERVKLDLHYEKIANNPNKEFISELLSERIYLSNKLDSLLNSFEMKYPRYANLKFDNKTIKISDVQNNIDDDTQLLTYFLGEKDLYTFNITKNNITFLKGKVADELLEKTKSLKDNLVQRKNVEDISKRLYLFLLSQQIENDHKNMVVIPDNVLNYIPFELLQRDNNDYLINDFTISYSSSVRLFLVLQSDHFKYESENFWAGFSPNYQNDKQLTSNTDEISTISKMIDGKIFIGEDSKKHNFLENNKKFSILHLAMHTEIDNINPMFNKLIFSDGDLTSSEIYVSESKANLAILSACNTGSGKLEKGEGIMSMARAFHFSGVPSVIMSLWKVPDKETKEIMIYFYKHLKKGNSKSEALKNAKLDYLSSTNDINLKHPYYWSGFVLNGNPDNLDTPKSKFYYLISGILIIGLLLFGRIIIKK
jgi:CHAT domain-containing protein